MKIVEIEEPTSFLGHVYLECTERESKPNEKSVNITTKWFNPALLLEQPKNYQDRKSLVHKLQRGPTT